jgi:hypothetical protein
MAGIYTQHQEFLRFYGYSNCQLCNDLKFICIYDCVFSFRSGPMSGADDCAKEDHRCMMDDTRVQLTVHIDFKKPFRHDIIYFPGSSHFYLSFKSNKPTNCCIRTCWMLFVCVIKSVGKNVKTHFMYKFDLKIYRFQYKVGICDAEKIPSTCTENINIHTNANRSTNSIWKS